MSGFGVDIRSFNLLDHDFKYDATLGEFEADVLTGWSYLTQLGYSIEPLLGSDNYSPLAPILFLKKLDKHICGIVRKAFCSNSGYNVVLAEVFEVLSGVFSTFDPKRIILAWLALVWNLSVQ